MPDENVAELTHEAQVALLKAIKECASDITKYGAALTYAEAYAWISRPNQPHG